MVRLAHLCVARPQDVTSIRPREIVAGGDVWLHAPRHKSEHLVRSKVIIIGRGPRLVARRDGAIPIGVDRVKHGRGDSLDSHFSRFPRATSPHVT